MFSAQTATSEENHGSPLSDGSGPTSGGKEASYWMKVLGL